MGKYLRTGVTDLLLPFRYILQQVNSSFLTISEYQGVVEIEEISLEPLLRSGGRCFYGMTQASYHEKMERQIKAEHLQYCKMR